MCSYADVQDDARMYVCVRTHTYVSNCIRRCPLSSGVLAHTSASVLYTYVCVLYKHRYPREVRVQETMLREGQAKNAVKRHLSGVKRRPRFRASDSTPRRS